MIAVGIDYSITSTSLVIIEDNKISSMFAIKARKKQEVNNPLITLLEYPLYKTELERFDKLSSLFLNFIPSNIDIAYLEGYSYGPSAGMIFNIAEATGLFKYKFQKKFGKEVEIIAPTAVKKFATGKGTAKKRQMVDMFIKNEFNIYESFGLIDDGAEKIVKPIDDICDAYWIAKYAYEHGIT